MMLRITQVNQIRIYAAETTLRVRRIKPGLRQLYSCAIVSGSRKLTSFTAMKTQTPRSHAHAIMGLPS